MASFDFKRMFLSCGRRLMPKSSADITEEAVEEIERTTEKTRESADELENEINADLRRLQNLHATAPQQRSQQTSLMRKIKMQKARLQTLRNMELSATQVANDSRDALLVAANAKAHAAAVHAQKSALKQGNLTPGKIDSVLDDIENGKDAIMDAAAALGSRGVSDAGGADCYDVDAFLSAELGQSLPFAHSAEIPGMKLPSSTDGKDMENLPCLTSSTTLAKPHSEEEKSPMTFVM